jgi:hypothetical protein
VSDAHIHNNVMELINHRLFNTEKTYVHYCNEYQKFNGIPAVRFNDENMFFGRLEKKVTAGESFSFACDNKSVVTDWYRKLFAIASLETQSKMYLYTAGEDTVIQKDWNDKIIFYSPKITTGVDLTCIKSSEQFIYITGQSVSSISLLQMATRTRNMKRLNYYSCARSFESQYESFEDCRKKITEKYVVSELGFSYDNIESFITETNHFNRVELMHLNLYIRNCYALDLHNTNKLYYFEQELKAYGFCIQPSEGLCAKINKAIKVEFNEQSKKIKDEKYDLLIQSFNDSEIILPKGIQPMKERCNLLNLSTAEHVNEYKELIEDSANLDQFFNYNALKKSYDHCEMKVRDTVNRKMIAGIEKNKWFKIKYVHMLAKLCKIEDNLFDIASIQMPKLK